ncbi:MAG: tetratricopeptide repeat protein, partial [Candidatus Helarchaeota archaeon]
MSDDEIEHQVEVSKKVWSFLEEAGTENYYKIKDIKDPGIITTIKSHVAENLLKWHSEGKISFSRFCDRKSELKELVEHATGPYRVEIHGIGGVGKTCLIHAALLILKLKGKRIISLGPKQGYISGSGYAIFKKKCRDEHHHVTLKKEEITLDDVIDALSKFLKDPDDLRKKDKDVIIETISKVIEKEDLIVFIDDVHLATEAVNDLIQHTDSLVMSSRKQTGLASKEISLIGIPESDRKALINLISRQYSIKLSEDIKEKISTLAEGHPVSTELMVRNYNYINFDKIKEFKLKKIPKSSERQAKDFLKRLIEEILSEDEFSLLKDLSVLNTELDTNISRDVVKELYDEQDFLNLISKGMLRKREGEEGIHEFTFHHVQEALNDVAESTNHEKAIKYYEKKRKILGETIDDAVEMLYHQLRVKINTQLREAFLELSEKIKPVHLGFKRMIDIGLLLEDSFKDNDAERAPILGVLGNLYLTLNRYGEAEEFYLTASKTYMELAEESPETFKPDVAMMQNNFGMLYDDMNRHGEAEKYYLAALKTYMELAEKSPETFKPDVADTQNNLGVLFDKMNRDKEAEKYYLAAFKTYMKL